MARAIPKRSTDDYVMVGYRPVRGKPEVEWRCPDMETFKQFRTLVEAAWETGTKIPDPVALFGEVPRRPSKAELKRQAKQTKDAGTEATPYTVREWLGSTKKPGPYFDQNRKARKNREHYFPPLNRYGGHFANKPLDEVDWHDAELMLDKMLVCQACVARAEAAGEHELVADAPHRLRVTDDPFGECVDDEGEPSHYATLQRSTISGYLTCMKAVFAAAVVAGRPTRRVPRCRSMFGRENPFADHQIPEDLVDRPDDNDISEALTYRQLDRLDDGMPWWLESIVSTGAYGIFRRSELLGLEIDMIDWNAEGLEPGQACITLMKTYANGQVRGHGKNRHSIKRRVILHALAAEKLRRHIERNRSTPDPEGCEGCRNGHRRHEGTARSNPHRRGCDFGAGAPVWVDPTTGQRPHPYDFTGVIFAAAVANAGLDLELGFKITPKILRSTGATLLLQAGIPVTTVMAMGGWKNASVLLTSYSRSNDQAKIEAAAEVGRRAMQELGLSFNVEDLEAPLLRRQATVLLEKIAALEQQVWNLGGDPNFVLPVERSDWVKRPPSVWHDDERVRYVIETMPTQRQMILALGFRADNRTAWRRLRSKAQELGLDLPANWGKRFDWDGDPEPMKKIVRTSKTRLTILTRFGLCRCETNRVALEEWATCNGVDLPADPGPTPIEFTDHEAVRAAIALGGSQKAILERFCRNDISGRDYQRLATWAEENGAELPPKRGLDTGAWLADEGTVRSAIAEGGYQKDILRRLGRKYPTTEDYERLRAWADEHGEVLPSLYGSQRRAWLGEDERIVAAISESESQTAIMRFLGRSRPTSDDLDLLAEWAEDRGLDLPPRKGSLAKGHWLSDADAVSAAIAGGGSQTAILRRLGRRKPASEDLDLLEEWAGDRGVELPPKHGSTKDAWLEDDEAVRAAVAEGGSQTAILGRLGRRGTPEEKVLLAAWADENGIEITPLLGSTTGAWLADDEAVRAAIAAGGTQTAILRRLCTREISNRDYRRLQQWADENGVELPAKQQRVDWFQDDDAIRAAVAEEESQNAILRRLCEGRTHSSVRLQLKAWAAENGVELPVQDPPPRGSTSA
jgi:integrase